jgi:hypothetical protein
MLRTDFLEARDRADRLYQYWVALDPGRRSKELKALRDQLGRLSPHPGSPAKTAETPAPAPRDAGATASPIPTQRSRDAVAPILPSGGPAQGAEGAAPHRGQAIEHDTKGTYRRMPTKRRPPAPPMPGETDELALRARAHSALKSLEPLDPGSAWSVAEPHLRRAWSALSEGAESPKPLPPVPRPTDPPR